MSAVDIGVGHDDDAFISQVVDVEFQAGLHAHGLAQVVDFLVGRHFARRRAEHVEDFAFEGKNGLGFAVAALFGGTASGVSFHEEQFGILAVFAGAVGEFSW